MPIEVRKLEYHLFVCTNEREASHPRGCCTARGSMPLVAAFKEALKDRGLNVRIRAQKAGCLDVCEFGPSVVIYPGGVWYGKVREKDVAEIVESHLIKGKPVERLRIPGK